MRGFSAHRRFSITHRAVQRLRELVTSLEAFDDENLRDRLDESLRRADDGGQAIETLDAMLGEPQTLIPIDTFEETMYAIVKEDTVVTVLPKGHGEEILQRGLALEERVRTGEVHVPDREERWEMRRRHRRDAVPPTVVVEQGGKSRVQASPIAVAANSHFGAPDTAAARAPKVVRMRPKDPVGAALFDALERGERRAVVEALSDELVERGPDAKLLPLWNELALTDLPAKMTVGDLVQACLTAAD